jgi:hypothetical protein
MRPVKKILLQVLLSFFLGFFALRAAATTYYVNINNATPSSPYTNWSMASTDIQSAINQATNGDLVLVTNGVYNNDPFGFIYSDPSNQLNYDVARIGISSGVTVSSVNGPAFTMIPGQQQFTCVFLASNATLSGFTLTNGSGLNFGGGAFCQATNAVISNCLICSNNAFGGGGGAYLGTLNNCILSNNYVQYLGGGGSYGSVLNHCTLVGNALANIQNDPIYGSAAYGGTLNDCLLISNTAAPNVEGGATVYSNVLNNCLIIDNTVVFCPISVAIKCALTNCTIAENQSHDIDENVVINSCVLRNCVLYYNGYRGSYPPYGGSSLKNCCAEPDPNNPYGDFQGGSNGDLTNAPLFINTNGDFHLLANSPCINAGNNAYVWTTNDLDGNPRIVGGTVDIGCYEYQSPTSVISYAYLQQYGLPTDGSMDYADLDGTAFNVYQDWVCGLNPTNSTSVLTMLTPATKINTNGIIVTWLSVTNINYNLQRSTNLPAFVTIQNNIAGQAGTTSYTNTSATNSIPYFYRVGVVAP